MRRSPRQLAIVVRKASHWNPRKNAKAARTPRKIDTLRPRSIAVAIDIRIAPGARPFDHRRLAAPDRRRRRCAPAGTRRCDRRGERPRHVPSNAPARPTIPAVAKVAIERWTSTAVRSTGRASAAPVPSPRRRPRSKSGASRRCSRTARAPGSGDACDASSEGMTPDPWLQPRARRRWLRTRRG